MAHIDDLDPFILAERDDLDSLHVETTDRELVLRALADQCATEELVPADPVDLPRYGRFAHGEEDPTIRRFLIAPPGHPRWTTIYLSAPDWDHDWLPLLLPRLGCRAAYLMLHDGDVLTMHLHRPDGLAAAHVTSPVHFDMPEAPRAPALQRTLESFAGRSLSEEELLATIAPPGRIDVDGRLAMERVVALLGLPGEAFGAYRWSLYSHGVRVRPEMLHWQHVAFAHPDSILTDVVSVLASQADEEDAPRDDGTLPFKPR
jgi:hypothetical protein